MDFHLRDLLNNYSNCMPLQTQSVAATVLTTLAVRTAVCRVGTDDQRM